jgi:hypothetical protein
LVAGRNRVPIPATGMTALVAGRWLGVDGLDMAGSLTSRLLRATPPTW